MSDEFPLVWRDGKLVSKYSVAERKGSAPHVISDTMAPLKHMATGITSDSKSAHRRMTRASGCIEVGNDMKVTARAPIRLDKGQRRDNIRRAIYDLRNGR